MARIHVGAVLCALLALTMPSMLQPLSAQVTFFADFEDGSGENNPALWVPDNTGQLWTIADFPGSGKGLRQTVEGCGISGNTPLPGVTDFQDGIIQLDMSWDDDDSWGVIIRKTADDAGYLIVFGYIETTGVIIADLADGCAATGNCLDQVGCENGGAELIQVPHGFSNLTQDLSVSYTGRIEARGDTIRVWYLPTADIADPLGDLGVPLVEFQHSAHLGPGSVGIWHESQGGSMIDNVYIITGDPALATAPIPADQATDVLRDATLAWTPGEFANTHNISIGTSFDDVNNASVADPMGTAQAQGLTDSSYDAGRLDFGTTYYWRVDEVNGAPDFTLYKGNVWSFEVEPFSIPVSNISVTSSGDFGESLASKTIDGSGLADDLHDTNTSNMWISTALPATIEYSFDQAYKLHELWVWNSNQLVEAFLGFGAKDVTIETSVDGENWTVLEGVGPFSKAPGTNGYAHNTTVDFQGTVAQHVRLTVNAGHGFVPQASLSEVRFFFIPVHAREPHPADGGTAESVNTTLTWRAGREAGEHEVLFSSDQAAVADGSVAAVVTQDSSYTPAALNYSETYYWQITETNAVETPASHAGPIWSFMAPEYLVIDDFEFYADEELKEIWATWIDGFEDPGNGAIVGNGNEPETAIVSQGGKSMPIHYDNSSAPISAVTRTFDPALDWSVGNPTSLSLDIRGNAADFTEDADGNITISGAGADIWNTADQFRFAYRSLSGDGSITARVHSHTEVHNWSKVGVMIRESNSAESAMFMLPTTGVNGVRPQGRTATFVAAENMPGGLDGVQETIARDQAVWLRIERVGNDFSGWYSTEETVSTWTPLPGNPWTINMAANTLIGLAVTSHSPGNTVVAFMSDVSTTGNVAGGWTVEAIGVDQPSNDAAPMYVTVEDRGGRSATVLYNGGDPSATLSTVFQQWIIPLADLAPVSLNSIDSITVGVGTPGGAASGAQGTAYVDLLQVGTPSQ